MTLPDAGLESGVINFLNLVLDLDDHFPTYIT